MCFHWTCTHSYANRNKLIKCDNIKRKLWLIILITLIYFLNRKVIYVFPKSKFCKVQIIISRYNYELRWLKFCFLNYIICDHTYSRVMCKCRNLVSKEVNDLAQCRIVQSSNVTHKQRLEPILPNPCSKT
jgi:hypothetical protein